MKAVHEDTVIETAGKHRKFSPGNLLLFLIALSPVIYLAWLLSATAVNIVVMDEWDYVFLFRHLASHTLTLHDLLQQHNESRTTLPNLIVLGLGVLTHWDTRWDMWVTFLFACVISTSVYLLSRRTMNGRQGLALWASRIRDLARDAEEIYVFFKHESAAPDLANRLAAMLEESTSD